MMGRRWPCAAACAARLLFHFFPNSVTLQPLAAAVAACRLVDWDGGSVVCVRKLPVQSHCGAQASMEKLPLGRRSQGASSLVFLCNPKAAKNLLPSFCLALPVHGIRPGARDAAAEANGVLRRPAPFTCAPRRCLASSIGQPVGLACRRWGPLPQRRDARPLASPQQ